MAGKLFKFLILLSAAALLSACASSPKTLNEPWMQEVVKYKDQLGPDHKDSIENLFEVTPEMRRIVNKKFSRLPELRAARKLAMWLVDPEGMGMLYDIDANLTPAQTFEQGRGNCLSFTLLLIRLGEEIGVELNVNEVDLPNTWGQNEDKDLVFYRHVNAVFKNDHYTQVFDLAMEEYGPGYPQRFIGKIEGAALLLSNIGIQKMREGDRAASMHYLKLAVSMSPTNSDLWINFAAILKQTGEITKAEQAYLQAISLNDRNSLGASNLERIYRAQGRNEIADKYKKLAYRARQKNPYLHFQRAQEAFANQEFSEAQRSIKAAIRLHREDPQFYELRSRLNQIKGDYVAALRDLEKAHNISKNAAERGRYANKVDMVLARVKEQVEERRRTRGGAQRINLEALRQNSF